MRDEIFFILILTVIFLAGFGCDPVIDGSGLPGDEEDNSGEEEQSEPSVSIIENGLEVYTNRTLQFSAEVDGLDTTNVIWSVVGSDATKGSIDSSGLYTAIDQNLDVDSPWEVTIVATSEVNPSIYDEVTVTIKPILEKIKVFGGTGIADMIVWRNSIYMAADDGTNRDVLWKYDGTSDPVIDHDFPSESGDPGVHGLKHLLGDLVFKDSTNTEMVYDGINDPELFGWRVGQVYEWNGGGLLKDPIVFNNKLVFAGSDSSDYLGYTLWIYDGEDSPKELYTFRDVGEGDPTHFTLYNDKLYFEAFDKNRDSAFWVLHD